MKQRLNLPILWLALAFAASALGQTSGQTPALAQSGLTNDDVLALAKAGFNEEFIIETISASRTRFDTSVNGLVGLAKEGMTEKLIRCMVAAGSAPPAATESPAPPSSSPAANTARRVVVLKPSPSRIALATQTPYYQSTSVLWGLWKRQVGVTATPRPSQTPAPSPGGFYRQVRLPAAAPTAHPSDPVLANYVVLQ